MNSIISDYRNNWDILYLFVAALVVDLVVIIIIRTFPRKSGKQIQIWYDRFGLSAVLADVTILVIVFMIARYVYSLFAAGGYSIGVYFILLAVLIQVIHDILFYLFVILPVKRGQNALMDVYKDYAEENGAWIILADSGMIIGTGIGAMLLKSLATNGRGDVVWFIAICSLYILPYLLYIKVAP